MLELILCSLITVLPDYLFRRYRQGKHWGDQITFFTMWYELRWGITSCLILTVSLITVVFYYHPSTTNAGPYFRTIPLLPEGGGRVEEVFVKNGESVEAGDPLFSLLDSAQVAGVNLAEIRSLRPLRKLTCNYKRHKPHWFKQRVPWLSLRTNSPKSASCLPKASNW